MAQETAPPGWYHDGSALRWWDGLTWGPYAPTAPRDPVADGKALAVISHFGLFVCWFVLPLVIRIAGGRDNDYVRHHATEALNFMITASALYLVMTILWIGGIATLDDGGGVGFFLLWIGILVLQGAVLGFSIMAAVRASQGVWWRYPVSIRFVPGARPR